MHPASLFAGLVILHLWTVIAVAIVEIATAFCTSYEVFLVHMPGEVMHLNLLLLCYVLVIYAE